MATQTLSYCTDCELECTAFPAFALLCVPVSIVANPIFENSPSPLISVIQSVRESTCADPCGPGKFVYTIDYDDAELKPGYLLTPAYIHSILCDDCLISLLANLVNSLPTMIQEIILQILAGYFLNTPSINFTTVGSNTQADVNISADPGNCLVENADGLFAPCGSTFLGAMTIDLNSAAVETISINSSNYIITNMIAANASVPINNAVIQAYFDVGLTLGIINSVWDLTGGVFTDSFSIQNFIPSDYLPPARFNRRTETTLYIEKQVLEGAPATIEILVYGLRLD